MTPDEAKKIIEKFHQAIKDLRPNAIVQSSKELPCTSARIKYAHFVYVEHFIKDGFYIEAKTKETKEEMLKSFEKKYQALMESYGIIDSLFSEDPEPINAKYEEYLEGLKNGIITDFRLPNPFGECEPVNEFHNFIGECWFLEHHTNLFSDNPLGAFIYDAVRNKAMKEKDIKTLIEIVNTGLTRTVDYPNKTNSNKFI
ncbi:MAG: hypothetical protein PHH83_02880 [Patescibacteria group bacterium]|nr:hypothetical protein [Patescibacteria group bacterium]